MAMPSSSISRLVGASGTQCAEIEKRHRFWVLDPSITSILLKIIFKISPKIALFGDISTHHNHEGGCLQ